MNVKQLRIRKGLSQSKLAEISGVSQPCIHYMENGKKEPTIRTLRKIAKALDVSVTILLDGKESA